MFIRKKEDQILTNVSVGMGIEQLPIKQRIVLALRVAGYTQLESGTILGVTRAAVSGTLKRAVLRLQKLIVGEDNDDESWIS